jgi:hypothetical protein
LWKAANSFEVIELSVGVLRKEEDFEEDLYMKWRSNSSNLVSVQVESTLRKLDKLEDNRKKRENTITELRCYSDP